MNVKEQNQKFITLMSYYLNFAADFITPELIDDITSGEKTVKQQAYGLLLASACGLDTANNPEDKAFYRKYFVPSIKMLDVSAFCADPYYRNIKPPQAECGDWKLEYMKYKPYELFPCGDFEYLSDGTVYPQLGFFDREFEYLAVAEKGIEWMTLTPNEITTMKEPVAKATGNVLTFGLGCGYFAYSASLKENVKSVTVVEKNGSAIRLFEKTLLPCMKTAEKIHIVECDAFEYADKVMKNGNFDFVFTDLWHDPSDGVEMYKKMKRYENNCPKAEFSYWIEKTMRYYL